MLPHFIVDIENRWDYNVFNYKLKEVIYERDNI